MLLHYLPPPLLAAAYGFDIDTVHLARYASAQIFTVEAHYYGLHRAYTTCRRGAIWCLSRGRRCDAARGMRASYYGDAVPSLGVGDAAARFSYQRDLVPSLGAGMLLRDEGGARSLGTSRVRLAALPHSWCGRPHLGEVIWGKGAAASSRH